MFKSIVFTLQPDFFNAELSTYIPAGILLNEEIGEPIKSTFEFNSAILYTLLFHYF